MTVDHDVEGHRFSTQLEGHRAVLDYQLAGAVMTITHTHVPPAIEGRGVAAGLMQAALHAARHCAWRVVPACSYAAAYLRRHPDAVEKQHQEDLLDEALDESFPASDPPAMGRST